MSLALMAKAFKLNYSTPTNNNPRISSNPRNRQIAQLGMNMGQNRQMQMIEGNGNQNQIGNGNLVAARAEGNAAGQNGNQIRCYNCRGVVWSMMFLSDEVDVDLLLFLMIVDDLSVLTESLIKWRKIGDPDKAFVKFGMLDVERHMYMRLVPDPDIIIQTAGSRAPSLRLQILTILSLQFLHVSAEAPGNGKANTVKMAEIMFETFNISAMCIVVDSSDGVSNVVPVYEGYAISNVVNRLDLVVRDISKHVATFFKRRFLFETTAGLE
nr:actin [Tanacetum cinerariifolium]